MLDEAGYYSSNDADPLMDFECEKAILGAVLFDPSAMMEIAARIEADDFGYQINRVVWLAMVALDKRGQLASQELVSGELSDTGRLNVVGGNGYLSGLYDGSVSTAYIPSHCDRLIEVARHRRARDTLRDVAVYARDPSVSSDELERRVNGIVTTLCGRPKNGEVLSGGDLMDSVIADLMREDATIGLATPFPSLTKTLGGYQGGQLIVVGARPSVGKTSLAIQSALCAADQTRETGAVTLVCSLETRRLPLGRRMMAVASGVDLDVVMRRRAMSDLEMGRIQVADAYVRELPLCVIEKPNQSLAMIRANAYRLKSQRGLALVVIDYLGLMAVSREKGRNRQEEVSELSRGLKIMAGDLDVPVMVLAQLNREVAKEKRKPRIDDLRESGAIEQDADVIMFLHREGDGDPSQKDDHVSLIVAKSRDGARDVPIELLYRKATTTFREPEGEFAQPSPNYQEPDSMDDFPVEDA